MAKLRLFASAREVAGVSSLELHGPTVGAVLEQASLRWGEPFVAVLERSQVWLNGEPTSLDDRIGDEDEVAVLPPVSGGADAGADAGVSTKVGAIGPTSLLGHSQEAAEAVPGVIAPTRAQLTSTRGSHKRRAASAWLWVVLTLLSLLIGPWAVALVVATIAALAADGVIKLRRDHTSQSHTPQLHRSSDQRNQMIDLTEIDLRGKDALDELPSGGNPRSVRMLLIDETKSVVQDGARLSAVIGAATLPLLGSRGGIEAVTLGLPILVIVPLVARIIMPATNAALVDDLRARNGRTLQRALVEMTLAMMSAFVFGISAAMLVVINRFDATTSVILMLMIVSFDIGNFLIGSGAGSRWEGMAAGVIAVWVMGFATWVVVGASVGDDVTLVLIVSVSVCALLGLGLMNVLVGGRDRLTPPSQRIGAYLVSLPIASYLAAIVG